MKNTVVGLLDKQHGEVTALVKKHRVLCRVGKCSILRLTSPHSFIMEKIELVSPQLKVLVSCHHPLTLDDPQLFSCCGCGTVASNPSRVSFVQENVAKSQYHGCGGEQTI